MAGLVGITIVKANARSLNFSVESSAIDFSMMIAFRGHTDLTLMHERAPKLRHPLHNHIRIAQNDERSLPPIQGWRVKIMSSLLGNEASDLGWSL